MSILFVNWICETYYNVHNADEMNKFFEEVLIYKNDPKKQGRLALLKKLNYPNSAEFIVEDILKNLL